jgi:CheY-like chemotaxis protein
MRPRVLVVDDQEAATRLFVEGLRDANYDATGTTSPKEALRLALASKPAVVILDIAMKEMGGYDLGRLLRSRAETKDTLLIAVSGHAPAVVEQLAPPGGWDAFAAKPITPGALAALVGQVLARAGASGQ